MIKSEIIQHKLWGRVVSLRKGDVELQVMIDKGPRIIGLFFQNKENIFFEDKEDEVSVSKEKLGIFGDNDGWHVFGGHRLWVAPETDLRTYYPDNNEVDFRQDGNKYIFTSPIEAWTNLQKQMVIEFIEDKIVVTYYLTNKGAFAIKCSPWASTAVKPGGVCILPQCKTRSGLNATTALSIWPYTKLNDSRFEIQEDYFLINATEEDREFKIGYFCEEGWIGYAIDGIMFKKEFSSERNAQYVSYGSNIEVYTCKNMLEMESVGKLQIIEPEETVSHVEQWSVSTLDEKYKNILFK